MINSLEKYESLEKKVTSAKLLFNIYILRFKVLLRKSGQMRKHCINSTSFNLGRESPTICNCVYRRIYHDENVDE